MKKRSKAVVTRSAIQFASALGLTPADAVEIEVRSILNAFGDSLVVVEIEPVAVEILDGELR